MLMTDCSLNENESLFRVKRRDLLEKLIDDKKNAEGGTRTRTALRPLDPEPSASASSATSARLLL